MTSCEDIADFLAPETVQLNDSSHRGLGLWAIDTINPNAWGGALEYLATTAADIVMVQEARVAAEDIPSTEKTTSNLGWKLSIEKCRYGGSGGKSAGVAVGCKAHIGMGESCTVDARPDVLSGRFQVKHVGAICKGGKHSASAYLIDGIGVSHKRNLDILQGIAGVLKTLHGPWMLAADFNCTPQQLQETGWLELVNGTIVAGEATTCMGRVIDYFVVANELAPFVEGVRTVNDALCNPHKPVRLYINAKPRVMPIRTLKNAGKIGAELPFGPSRQERPLPDDIDTMSNHQRYNVFLERLEDEAAHLGMMTEEERTKLASMVKGPTFVLKDPLRNANGAGARRTTAVSRAWRKCANWLGHLYHKCDEKEKAEAIRKILYYKHPWPKITLATQEQVKAFEAFLVWKGLVSHQLLDSPEWARMMQGTAVENAEREERAAQYAAMVKWQAWIHEGPAAGLKRQHRFSRTPTGWIPTVMSTGNCDGIELDDEVDGLDGLTAEQLSSLKHEHADKDAPACSQQEVDDQADKWHREWGKGIDHEPIQWPEDLGEDLADLLVEELLDAAATFPNETGLGWDQIHPKAITGYQGSYSGCW